MVSCSLRAGSADVCMGCLGAGGVYVCMGWLNVGPADVCVVRAADVPAASPDLRDRMTTDTATAIATTENAATKTPKTPSQKPIRGRCEGGCMGINAALLCLKLRLHHPPGGDHFARGWS